MSLSQNQIVHNPKMAKTKNKKKRSLKSKKTKGKHKKLKCRSKSKKCQHKMRNKKHKRRLNRKRSMRITAPSHASKRVVLLPKIPTATLKRNKHIKPLGSSARAVITKRINLDKWKKCGSTVRGPKSIECLLQNLIDKTERRGDPKS